MVYKDESQLLIANPSERWCGAEPGCSDTEMIIREGKIDWPLFSRAAQCLYNSMLLGRDKPNSEIRDIQSSEGMDGMWL